MQVEGKKRLIFLANLTVVFIFLLWRCKFGISNSDESFYVSLPYRLAQGDGLFVHEWHVAQMSAFLLLPFVKLYLLIAGGTDGILLFFRYFYTVVWALEALFIFCKTEKYSYPGACLASLIFFIYAPFGISAFSYNTMGILCLTNAVLLITGSPKSQLSNVLGGLFLAGAVLCCPYLVLLYGGYVLLFLIKKLGGAKIHSFAKLQIFELKSFFCFHIGIAVMAALFLAFVFSRATLAEIIEAFPYIINDPTHDVSVPFYREVLTYFTSILRTDIYTMPEYLLSFVLWLFILFDKKPQRKRAYFCIAVLLTLASEITIFFVDHYINNFIYPLNILAFLCYFLVEDKEKANQQFYTILIPGMVYSLCLHLSSNQAYLAISSASIVALTGGISIICIAARELAGYPAAQHAGRSLFKEGKPVLCVAVLFAVVLLSELEIRYSNVFWDDPINYQTTYLDKGPEKGIYASETSAQTYNDIYSIITKIESEHEVRSAVFCADKLKTVYYLIGNVENASCSSWMLRGKRKKIMKAYYKLNPQKIPDLIYISNDESGKYMKWLYKKDDYDMILNENGNTAYYRKNRF